MVQQHDSDDWRGEFQPAELAALRERIPTAIQRSCISSSMFRRPASASAGSPETETPPQVLLSATAENRVQEVAKMRGVFEAEPW